MKTVNRTVLIKNQTKAHGLVRFRRFHGVVGFFAHPSQGKEYVFIANSDNLGAIVDLSILIVVIFGFQFFTFYFLLLICAISGKPMWILDHLDG